jgi:hypothetical protein
MELVISIMYFKTCKSCVRPLLPDELGTTECKNHYSLLTHHFDPVLHHHVVKNDASHSCFLFYVVHVVVLRHMYKTEKNSLENAKDSLNAFSVVLLVPTTEPFFIAANGSSKGLVKSGQAWINSIHMEELFLSNCWPAIKTVHQHVL